MLFSPGNDPFSSFGRGWGTSIANILALERDAREKKRADQQSQLFDEEMGNRLLARQGVQGMDTTERFQPTPTDVVQGKNLDYYAQNSGIMPPDELGTDTTGVRGQMVRKPETLGEMGLNPMAAAGIIPAPAPPKFNRPPA